MTYYVFSGTLNPTQSINLAYYTKQNTDGIPSFVQRSLQLRKKLGWSVQVLGGPDPPTPQWLRPCLFEFCNTILIFDLSV